MHYYPPEMLLDLQMPYSFPQDIWQLGNLMYELANHEPAYPLDQVNNYVSRIFDQSATTDDPLYLRMQKNDIERIPSHYGLDMWMIIRKCLNSDPSKRPTIT
jgi:serine/threonine protein kinase